MMRTLGMAVLALGLLAATASAKAPANDATQAEEHYKRGKTLYNLGKYDEAIHEFEAAYEIKDEPVLLYNIAQAHRLANRYPEALRFYRNYLRVAPRVANKAEVETKIADMENLIAQQNRVSNGPPSDTGGRPSLKSGPSTPVKSGPATSPSTGGSGGQSEATATVASAQQPVSPAATEEQPEGRTERRTEVRPESEPAGHAPVEETPPGAPRPGRAKIIAGIALAAAGVLAVGGGVAMGMMAKAASDQQESNAAAHKPFDPALESSGKTFQVVGLALDVVGGALVAAGVVVAVLGVRDKAKAAEHPISLLPTVRPGFAGTALHVTF